MRKVLFIVPSLMRAGAETQLIDLIGGLPKEEFGKYLLSFESNLDQLSRVNRKEVSFRHVPRRYKYDFGVAKAAAKLIDQEQIDVVHCTLQIALFVGWLGIKLARRKPLLMVTVHTTMNRAFREEAFDRVLYQWLMRGCLKVIFVCERQAEHWQRKFTFLKSRAVVVHNGIDAEHFSRESFEEVGRQLKAQLGIPVDAIVVCHVAAFRPEKGHKILLAAFASVLRNHPNTYLLFAGDGPIRSSIEEQARHEQLDGCIRFLGNIPDVRPLLAGSNISVLASTSETFSMAMLESLAMEVPMVATDIGGASEAIQEGRTGLLVPPADASALASAIEHLIKDHSVRRQMGQAGRALIKERFTQRGMRVATSEVLKAVRC